MVLMCGLRWSGMGIRPPGWSPAPSRSPLQALAPQLPGTLRVADLFSGSGAVAAGMKQAGHRVDLLCDSDPACQRVGTVYPQYYIFALQCMFLPAFLLRPIRRPLRWQVLRHRFPDVPVAGDVANIKCLPLGIQLLCAGFPCIDFSRRGKRQGFKGTHAALVDHVFRLLNTAITAGCPVHWVLLENVEGLLDTLNGQPAIDYIASCLEQMGYKSWATRVIATAGFGLPSKRRRTFLLACWCGDARDVLLSQGMCRCLGSCTKGLHGEDGRPCFECYEDGCFVDWEDALKAWQQHDSDATSCEQSHEGQCCGCPLNPDDLHGRQGQQGGCSCEGTHCQHTSRGEGSHAQCEVEKAGDGHDAAADGAHHRASSGKAGGPSSTHATSPSGAAGATGSGAGEPKASSSAGPSGAAKASDSGSAAGPRSGRMEVDAAAAAGAGPNTAQAGATGTKADPAGSKADAGGVKGGAGGGSGAAGGGGSRPGGAKRGAGGAPKVDELRHHSLCMDLGNAQSPPSLDMVPTMTTTNGPFFLALANGKTGLMRIEDGEVLQGLPRGWTKAAARMGAAERAEAAREADREDKAQEERAAEEEGETDPGTEEGAAGADAAPAQAAAEAAAAAAVDLTHISDDDASMDDSNVITLDDSEGTADGGVEEGSSGKGEEAGGDDGQGAAAGNTQAANGVTADTKQAAPAAATGAAAAAEAGPAGPQRVVSLGDRKRWKMLGNAVSLPVARWLGERLRAYLVDHKYHESDRDVPMPSKWQCDPKFINAPDMHARIHFAALARELRRTKVKPTARGKAAPVVPDLDEGWPGGVEMMGEAGGEEEEEGQDDMGFTEKAARAAPGARRQAPREMTGVQGSWPRCAWYVAGRGRFCIKGRVSECPIKTPFYRLGEVVWRVGKQPQEQRIVVYINRLLERGHDMTTLTHYLLHSRHKLPAAVTDQEVRLQRTVAAGSAGLFVWVVKPGSGEGQFWPGEAFDPWQLPANATLRLEEVMALSVKERRSCVPPWEVVRAKRGETTDPAADAAAFKAVARGSAAAKAPPADKRKLLVRLFGLGPEGQRLFVWESSARTHDYLECRKQYVALMKCTAHTLGVSCDPAFAEAVKEADAALQDRMSAALAVKAAIEAKAGQLRLGATQQEVVAWASEQSDLACRQHRCGKCRACAPTAGKSVRRCIRARAAALSMWGHQGAQLTMLGEGCVGARVSVYWCDDEESYNACITSFDRYTLCATLKYDDGEVETFPMWAPGEDVRLLSCPEEWVHEAAQLYQERHWAMLQAEQERLRKLAAEQARAAPPPAAKVAYESEREEQLRKKQAKLAELGLLRAPPQPQEQQQQHAVASGPCTAAPAQVAAHGLPSDPRRAPAAAAPAAAATGPAAAAAAATGAAGPAPPLATKVACESELEEQQPKKQAKLAHAGTVRGLQQPSAAISHTPALGLPSDPRLPPTAAAIPGSSAPAPPAALPASASVQTALAHQPAAAAALAAAPAAPARGVCETSAAAVAAEQPGAADAQASSGPASAASPGVAHTVAAAQGGAVPGDGGASCRALFRVVRQHFSRVPGQLRRPFHLRGTPAGGAQQEQHARQQQQGAVEQALPQQLQQGAPIPQPGASIGTAPDMPAACRGSTASLGTAQAPMEAAAGPGSSTLAPGADVPGVAAASATAVAAAAAGGHRAEDAVMENVDSMAAPTTAGMDGDESDAAAAAAEGGGDAEACLHDDDPDGMMTEAALMVLSTQPAAPRGKGRASWWGGGRGVEEEGVKGAAAKELVPYNRKRLVRPDTVPQGAARSAGKRHCSRPQQGPG